MVPLVVHHSVTVEFLSFVNLIVVRFCVLQVQFTIFPLFLSLTYIELPLTGYAYVADVLKPWMRIMYVYLVAKKIFLLIFIGNTLESDSFIAYGGTVSKGH